MESALRRAFAGVGVSGRAIQSTAQAGDERLLLERALGDGATTIVVVGGDGTWSKAASAILKRGVDCRLGLIAAGTGNDFAKSLDLPASDFVASARLAVDGPDARVDVGRIEDEWFLNAVGFGFDVAVLESAARVGWLSGNLLYAYAALQQLLRYHGLTLRCDALDGTTAARQLLLVIANGRCFGGAFQIVPNASVQDGLLDMISIADASSLERLRLFIRATRGRHAMLPSVVTRQSRRFVLEFESVPLYDLDGELRRARASTVGIECVPLALRVVGAKQAWNKLDTKKTRKGSIQPQR